MRLDRLYEIVEGGRYGSRAGRLFDGFIGLLILVATSATVLSTDASLADIHPLLEKVEAFCIGAFIVEYLLRVLVVVKNREGRFSEPVWGRLRYIVTPLAIIDLIAIMPGVLIVLNMTDPELLLLLRCARLMKLLRYFSAFETLAIVIRNESKPLLASGTLLIILLVVFSTAGYLIEKDAQPDNFGSIPKAMWWGIVTLATVGYGDVVPVTPLGKVLGGFAVVIGMGMFALPAGIIATGFAEEMRRRNFVVTWSLVAKVPFFEHLPAARIAEIAAKLESRVASRSEAVIMVGEPADAMYFIVEGEVEVKLPHGPVHLRSGDFFGEIALLSGTPRRNATVTARTFCQLLKLRTDHFRQLMASHEDLAENMRRVADERMKRNRSSAEKTAETVS